MKFKSKFSVGDRVAVYGHLMKSIPERGIAEVSEIHPDGNLRLKFAYGFSMSAFPQQCRRLVKKPRRSGYIINHDCPSRAMVVYQVKQEAEHDARLIRGDGYKAEVFEFIEVKK